MPVYKKINKDFFKLWTSNMAYVLGFFSADGYITVNKRGGQFWCIEIADKLLLEQIKKNIQADHVISVRRKKGNRKVTYRLQIGSIEMCNDLRRWGIHELKTYNMITPHIPLQFLKDFTRGYFDGDGNVWLGYIHKERRTPILIIQIAFTSSSLLFLEGLKNLLQPTVVSGGSIYKPKNENFYRLQFSNKDALKLYEFMYNHEARNGAKDLFLPRKKNVFKRYIKMRS